MMISLAENCETPWIALSEHIAFLNVAWFFAGRALRNFLKRRPLVFADIAQPLGINFFDLFIDRYGLADFIKVFFARGNLLRGGFDHGYFAESGRDDIQPAGGNEYYAHKQSDFIVKIVCGNLRRLTAVD